MTSSRRMFLAGCAVTSIGVLAGCDSEPRPDPVASVLNSEGIKDAMNRLSGAVQQMEGDVGDFETMDWKEVVPNVETAATDVRNAFDELKKSLGYSS